MYVYVLREWYYLPLSQSSLRDVLDLSFFACENVRIALAAVNGRGISDFTSQSSITVHGGTYIYNMYINVRGGKVRP